MLRLTTARRPLSHLRWHSRIHTSPPRLWPRTTTPDSSPQPSSSTTADAASEHASPRATESSIVDEPVPPPSNTPADAIEKKAVLRPVDIDKLKEQLKLWTEDTAVTIRKRADQYTASAATSFAQLGRELNKVTGYEAIETLKREVVTQEARIRAAREAARNAKLAHEQAVLQRAQSQREVNDLLQRKSSWTDDDVGRFTSLVRQDHLYEQAESKAKDVAAQTEDEVDREFTELMRVILNRYHEEQVWSDKIRSASTYGSLTVLGLNMLVFILAIVVVEPWKRKRLAQTFEKKVEEMSASTMAGFEEKTTKLAQQLDDQAAELRKLVEVVSYSMQPGFAVLEEAVAPREVSPQTAETFVGHSQQSLWVFIASTAGAAVLGSIVGCYIKS